MSRINVGINPKNLTDQHLLAEHREIKRICSLFSNKKKPYSIPNQFSLGTGHMLFFLDKGTYTLNRYKSLHQECLRRGFNVEDYSSSWRCYENTISYYKKDWIATEKDAYAIIERITTRINESVQIPRYLGEKIDKNVAINLLSSNKINTFTF